MFLQRSASLLPSPERLDRLERLAADVERHDLPAREAAVVERVGRIAGLGEVARRELAAVDDDEAAARRSPTFAFNAAGFIATRTSGSSPAVSMPFAPKLIWNALTPNVVPCGARISAEVGEGGEILAGERGRQGELAAGQLHPVAAVAGEADDHRLGVVFARSGTGASNGVCSAVAIKHFRM